MITQFLPKTGKECVTTNQQETMSNTLWTVSLWKAFLWTGPEAVCFLMGRPRNEWANIIIFIQEDQTTVSHQGKIEAAISLFPLTSTDLNLQGWEGRNKEFLLSSPNPSLQRPASTTLNFKKMRMFVIAVNWQSHLGWPTLPKISTLQHQDSIGSRSGEPFCCVCISVCTSVCLSFPFSNIPLYLLLFFHSL